MQVQSASSYVWSRLSHREAARGGAVGDGGGVVGEGGDTVREGGGVLGDGGGAIEDGRHKDTYLTRQGWVKVPKFSGMRSPPRLPLLFGWGSLVSVFKATTSLPLGAEPDRKKMKEKEHIKTARKHYTICSGRKHTDKTEMFGKTKAECRLFTQTSDMFRALKRSQRPTERLWSPMQVAIPGEGTRLLGRDQEEDLQNIHRRILNMTYRRIVKKTEKTETTLEPLIKHV